MVKLRQLLTALALLVTCTTLASAQQTRRVTGRVTAQGTGEALAGASVQVMGTQIGQYSDEQGRFSILVPSGPQQLRVRRIGYKAQVLPIGADQTELNVSLVKDVLQLEAQVVTGAATSVSRQNVATDVAVISGDQLNEVPTPTLENALQGKVAGAQITQNSGAPGGGMQVRLRGVTSVFGASDPLYVIDGVLVSNAVVNNGLNAISQSNGGLGSSSQDNGVNRIADLNPADVESIEVLKGSSASAIYGSKAANGVIIIKTKQGRAGRTEFNVTQRLGQFSLANKVPTRRFTLDEALAYNAELRTPRPESVVRENWERCNGFCDHQEQLFGRKDLSYETNVSVRGGNERTRYFASGLAKEDAGIAQNTGYKKQALRLNLSQLAGSRLTFNLNTNLTHSITERGISNNDNINATPYFVFGSTPSYLDFRPVNGQYPRWNASNPLQTFASLRTPEEVWRGIGAGDVTFNAIASQNQTLDFRLIGGIDQFSQQNTLISPRELQFEPGDDFPGTIVNNNAVYTSANWTASVTHGFSPSSKLFGATTSLGIQREYRGSRGTNLVGQDCPSGQTSIALCSAVSAPETPRNQQYDLAWYAQEEVLALNERLLVTAAARGQRSTANGDVDKFYVFPKASASYRLPGRVPGVEELKLRVATGKAGNQPLPFMKFTTATPGNYDGRGGVSGGTVRGSSDIRPEISSEIEGGFDITAFASRASLNVTFYQKNVSDLVLRPAPAPSTGYTQAYINGGELRNRGTEIALALTPVDGNNAQWVSRTTFTRNVGLVTSLPTEVPSTGFTIGGAFGYGQFRIREGYAPTAIFGRDLAGTANMEIANTAPDFIMGFSNEFSYKRLRLSGLLEWQKGGDILNITQDVYDSYLLGPDTLASLQRLEDHEEIGSFVRNWQDGSFVKLREVTLSYELPDALRTRLFSTRARSIRAELSGRNLYTWTKYEGADPEVSNFGNQNIIRNADLAPFPPSRAFFFSLSVDF